MIRQDRWFSPFYSGNPAEEKYFFIHGYPREWDSLPKSDNPITVGIDGGYLRNWHNRKSNFEVIVGKSVPTERPAKCFGFVQQFDKKPKRRLYDLLQSQGMQMNQDVHFLSDGEKIVRDLQLYLNPNAEHILDWFHIAMRFTVLKQFVKGIVKIEKADGKYARYSPAREIQEALDSAKWKLWHGKVHDALEYIDDIIALMYEFEKTYPKFKNFEKTVEEFHTYIHRNGNMIKNYGKYWREGRIISTAFIESLVNSFLGKRFGKKQQMQWTHEGAHMLLQIRAKVANHELADIFRTRYPDFKVDEKTEHLECLEKAA